MSVATPTGANIKLASHLIKELRDQHDVATPWCMWKDCDTFHGSDGRISSDVFWCLKNGNTALAIHPYSTVSLNRMG